MKIKKNRGKIQFAKRTQLTRMCVEFSQYNHPPRDEGELCLVAVVFGDTMYERVFHSQSDWNERWECSGVVSPWPTLALPSTQSLGIPGIRDESELN